MCFNPPRIEPVFPCIAPSGICSDGCSAGFDDGQASRPRQLLDCDFSGLEVYGLNFSGPRNQKAPKISPVLGASLSLACGVSGRLSPGTPRKALALEPVRVKCRQAP